MTQLWLVRHGQTAWNIEGRFQGQADPPLNATGWDQARALVPQLVGISFAALYSSDLQRAHTTARVIADSLGLPVNLEPGLREINQGEWEGMLSVDIRERFAEAWLARQRDPLNARAPGGESIAEVAERVWATVDGIVLRHPHRPILLVSHGLALATIICRARGLPLAEAHEYIPDNCAPDVVDWPPPH
jgi:2,3-bisphosphoglycerate-dependent phosphoglycerate mutase